MQCDVVAFLNMQDNCVCVIPLTFIIIKLVPRSDDINSDM